MNAPPSHPTYSMDPLHPLDSREEEDATSRNDFVSSKQGGARRKISTSSSFSPRAGMREVLSIVERLDAVMAEGASEDHERDAIQTLGIDLVSALRKASASLNASFGCVSRCTRATAIDIMDKVMLMLDRIVQGFYPQPSAASLGKLIEASCICFSLGGSDNEAASDALWKSILMFWNLEDSKEKGSCTCSDCASNLATNMKSFMATTTSFSPAPIPGQEEDDEDHPIPTFPHPPFFLRRLDATMRSGMHQNYDDDDHYGDDDGDDDGDDRYNYAEDEEGGEDEDNRRGDQAPATPLYDPFFGTFHRNDDRVLPPLFSRSIPATPMVATPDRTPAARAPPATPTRTITMEASEAQEAMIRRTPPPMNETIQRILLPILRDAIPVWGGFGNRMHLTHSTPSMPIRLQQQQPEEQEQEQLPSSSIESSTAVPVIPVVPSGGFVTQTTSGARTIWAEVVATQSDQGGFSAIFGLSRFGRDIQVLSDPDLLQICVDRSDVLVSTFKCLDKLLESNDLELWSKSRTPRVSVKFEHESGYGEGVLRDWVTLVMQEVYSPRSGIFKQIAPRVVHPATEFYEETNNRSTLLKVATPLKWGWLAGFVTGLAARSRIHTGYHLSNAFASLVLNRRPQRLMDAMREIDEEVATTCGAGGNIDIDDDLICAKMEGLSFDYKDSGLLPDGSGEDIRVKRSNVKLFLNLISARVCGIDDRHGEVASIARGFRNGLVLALGSPSVNKDSSAPNYSLLWKVAVEDFNDTLGGKLEVTADDVLSNVQFCQGRNVAKSRAEELVAHFKRRVTEMTDAQRRALLRFWTGSLTPLRASKMQFLVVEDHGEGRRPYSHTCYQQLTVPLAETPEETLGRLDESIANCEAIVD